jgi:hypothetical protein
VTKQRTTAERIEFIEAATGIKAPVALRNLIADQRRVEKARREAVAKREAAEERLDQARARADALDAEKAIVALRKGEAIDLGPDRVAEARAAVEGAQRIAKALHVAEEGLGVVLLDEIEVGAGMPWLEKVWAEAVHIGELPDTITLREARAKQAIAAEVGDVIADIFLGLARRAGATRDEMRSLRALFAERPERLPTLARLERRRAAKAS